MIFVSAIDGYGIVFRIGDFVEHEYAFFYSEGRNSRQSFVFIISGCRSAAVSYFNGVIAFVKSGKVVIERAAE